MLGLWYLEGQQRRCRAKFGCTPHHQLALISHSIWSWSFPPSWHWVTLRSCSLPPQFISMVREINEFPPRKCEGIIFIHKYCPKFLHICNLSWQGIGNYNNIYIDYKSPWVRQHKAREMWTSMTQIHRGPCKHVKLQLPGLGGTWAQQGWMFLMATNPLSATTPTVLPSLSRHFPSLLFSPTNFSVECHRILQLPGGHSFRGSIILLTASCRSCLKGREVSHFETSQHKIRDKALLPRASGVSVHFQPSSLHSAHQTCATGLGDQLCPRALYRLQLIR